MLQCLHSSARSYDSPNRLIPVLAARLAPPLLLAEDKSLYRSTICFNILLRPQRVFVNGVCFFETVGAIIVRAFGVHVGVFVGDTAAKVCLSPMVAKGCFRCRFFWLCLKDHAEVPSRSLTEEHEETCSRNPYRPTSC